MCIHIHLSNIKEKEKPANKENKKEKQKHIKKQRDRGGLDHTLNGLWRSSKIWGQSKKTSITQQTTQNAARILERKLMARKLTGPNSKVRQLTSS